jgi:hypothetical protein
MGRVAPALKPEVIMQAKDRLYKGHRHNQFSLWPRFVYPYPEEREFEVPPNLDQCRILDGKDFEDCKDCEFCWQAYFMFTYDDNQYTKVCTKDVAKYVKLKPITH